MIPASDCKLSFYFIIIILEEPWVNTPGFFYALFLVIFTKWEKAHETFNIY